MFHVIKHLNDCVSGIRRQLQHDLEPSDPDYRLLKGSMHILVTKQSGIDTKYDLKAPVVKKRIEKLLYTYPDLNEAYQALQSFHCINDMTMPVFQRAQLTEWLDVYCSSEVPEVRHVANLVRHWRGYRKAAIRNPLRYLLIMRYCFAVINENIVFVDMVVQKNNHIALNSWKYNKSNSVCEGYNNRIKVLKRTCYELHNFESFRKRILLTCGPTQFVTNPSVLFKRNRTKKGGSQL